ncbi:hypothetical protein EJ02DRAFT_463348 [Clathrospora elynae]|uniref:Uncharacterized protein n=1 Tax=Clathrospora elynae TaxID=706981 RepID=A0A6A5T431_9PLEO|nr:hypothetical protein EJ02DRAFT_463348 [Clathrospora elynae]
MSFVRRQRKVNLLTQFDGRTSCYVGTRDAGSEVTDEDTRGVTFIPMSQKYICWPEISMYDTVQGAMMICINASLVVFYSDDVAMASEMAQHFDLPRSKPVAHILLSELLRHTQHFVVLSTYKVNVPVEIAAITAISVYVWKRHDHSETPVQISNGTRDGHLASKVGRRGWMTSTERKPNN